MTHSFLHEYNEKNVSLFQFLSRGNSSHIQYWYGKYKKKSPFVRCPFATKEKVAKNFPPNGLDDNGGPPSSLGLLLCLPPIIELYPANIIY
jgi:hypothetical protein